VKRWTKEKIVNHESKKNKCSLCGQTFESRSHFDALCNVCWADNEMKPYLAFGGFRRVAKVN